VSARSAFRAVWVPLSGAAPHSTTREEAAGRARERDSRAKRGRVRSARATVQPRQPRTRSLSQD
jgi:hypothetical protein